MSLHGLVPVMLLAAVMSVSARAQDEQDSSRKDNFRYSLSAIEDFTVLGGTIAPTLESRFQNRLLLEPSFTYLYNNRWTLSSKVVGESETNGDTHEHLLVRETYAGLSVADFDFTVGRRLVHWGTGYAFTATGVLDPPLVATDPTDRLNIRAGRDMVKVDWEKGPHAVSLAYATSGLSGSQATVKNTAAFRYNILVNGFDTSIIAGKDLAGDSFAGVTFTRVLGQAWELHGDAAWRQHAAILIGGKYTARFGMTVIAELFSPPNIPYYRSETLSPSAGRQSYTFLRVGKSRLRELPGWKEWDAYASVVSNLQDHSGVLVIDVRRGFGNHFSSYVHMEGPFGSKRSEYGAIPYATTTSFGIRFQQ